HFPQGAATGLQNRDLLLVSGTGTIHHYLGKTTGRGAFVGVGAGGEYVQQYYQLGVNSQFTRTGFHFILAPEAGYTTPVMEGVDLVLAARYSAPTSAGNYLGGGSRRFGFLTFVFGLAEH
ncbi:MAG TPA: hypothetical protein VH277_09800, partial [Gemmatimonadaceae bacterium]|nr:hypothetical protein [Gemmatimonadaceae bacterium]